MIKTIQRTRRKPASLALHIRRLRQWCREGRLSQRDLAYLAGMSTRQLRNYETCRSLPQSIKSLLQLALALNVSVELLVDELLLERLRRDVESRRVKLAGRSKRCGRQL